MPRLSIGPCSAYATDAEEELTRKRITLGTVKIPSGQKEAGFTLQLPPAERH